MAIRLLQIIYTFTVVLIFQLLLRGEQSTIACSFISILTIVIICLRVPPNRTGASISHILQVPRIWLRLQNEVLLQEVHLYTTISMVYAVCFGALLVNHFRTEIQRCLP